MVKLYIFISGSVVIKGYECKLLKREVGMPGLSSDGFVYWCDVGELQQSGFCGRKYFASRTYPFDVLTLQVVSSLLICLGKNRRLGNAW